MTNLNYKNDYCHNNYNRYKNINIINSKTIDIRKNKSPKDINKSFFNQNNYYNIRQMLGSGPNGNKSLSLSKKQKPRLTLFQCFDSYIKPDLLTGSNQIIVLDVRNQLILSILILFIHQIIY